MTTRGRAYPRPRPNEHPGARPVAVERDEPRFLPDGGVITRQRVELTVERARLDVLWTPAGMEELVLAHWHHLRRVSLGSIRVVGTPRAPAIVLLARPLVMLSLHDPSYEVAAREASASLRIGGGLLVAPRPRGHGRFTITLRRGPGPARGQASVTVACEVTDFHPLIGAWGRSSRAARGLYRLTQLQVHERVTAGFLRSLPARLA